MLLCLLLPIGNFPKVISQLLSSSLTGEFVILAHKNEEDWAARARAWADAKAAMESQHPQSQFPPAGRLQEQSHFHDQYQQSVDSRHTDLQNQSHPLSSYSQFSVSDASMQRLPGHQQEAASVSSETSYTPDGHLSYNARDGTATGDPTVAFQHQGTVPTNPSVHQQEVPSSYNSVTGNYLFGMLNLLVKRCSRILWKWLINEYSIFSPLVFVMRTYCKEIF